MTTTNTITKGEKPTPIGTKRNTRVTVFIRVKGIVDAPNTLPTPTSTN